MKNLSKLQCLTYQAENQKLKQLCIEQGSPLLKDERLLAVYHGAMVDVPRAPRVSNPKAGGGGNGANSEGPAAP